MGLIVTTFMKLKDNNNIILTNALVSDAQNLLESIKISLNDNEGQAWTPYEYKKSEEDIREWISEMLIHPKKLLIIAKYENIIIGNLEFQIGDKLRTNHTGELGVGIIPNWRNKGIGTHLLNAFFDWTKSNTEIEKVNLSVLSNNSKAIKLYKKFGFQEEGKRIKAFKFSESYYVDDILMTKFLK